MGKSSFRRFLAVFATVFVIGQLVTALSLLMFPGPELQPFFGGRSFWEKVGAVGGFMLILFPGPIIPIILVSVFAMNRIRSLFMIALAAAATLLFVAWGTLRGGAFRISFGFVHSVSELLENALAFKLPDDLQIGLFYVLMAFVLFGISFLIIKLVAAIEKRFTTAQSEAA